MQLEVGRRGKKCMEGKRSKRKRRKEEGREE